MHGELLGSVLLVLAVGLGVALVASRFGISTLIAYLITGALVTGFGLVEHSQDMHTLGELGASLLLFSLGMEMDLPGMRKRLRQVLIGATLQIGLTIAAGFALMRLLDTPWQIALTMGCCLALSSTLMVLRALDEGGLRHKEAGQTVLGLLLTQDFCLAPLLIVLSLLVPSEENQAPLWLPAVSGVLLVICTVALRRVFISRMFNKVAAAKIPELEVAFSITIAIGAAMLTELGGLGAAVGAFCAGLAMGGDEHRHAIETATRPLQGLLAILFFIGVGLQFDVSYVISHLPLVIGGLVVAIVVKACLAGFAMRLSGLSVKEAIGAGIMVGQVGEFSFVLAASGPLDADTYKFVISVACLSLALTPLLISTGTRFLPKSQLSGIMKRGETIVIAGLGPVGNTVVEALHQQDLPLLLVDRNPKLLEPWADTEGISMVQGRIEVMDDWLGQLGERPRVVVLTFPIPDTSAVVAERLRAIDPQLTIIARTPFQRQIPTLKQAGVRYVLCDEMAAADALGPLLSEALQESDRRTTTRILRIATSARS